MALPNKTFEILSSASIYQGKETVIYQMRQGNDKEGTERRHGPM
jgi:hypothetical protein